MRLNSADAQASMYPQETAATFEQAESRSNVSGLKRAAWGKVGEGALVALIKGYRYGIRPMLGQRCRFFPSCSEYTLDAVQSHGAATGAFLGAKRILKCHPWHPGGFDPVPQKKY